MSEVPIGPNGLPLSNLGDPGFEGMRVFHVITKTFEDLESLYNDMENEGGPLHIPGRVVECTNRRDSERITDYLITHDEAVALHNDPRILGVELNLPELGIQAVPAGWTTSTNFNYQTLTGASTAQTTNRAFLQTRSYEAFSTNWYPNGTASPVTVTSDLSGKNVDVLVSDQAVPYPISHEWAQNSDGTGYSRMVQFDWSLYVGGSYWYTTPIVAGPYTADKYMAISGGGLTPDQYGNGHGTHCTGLAVGNLQGHARDSNIYNFAEPFIGMTTGMEVGKQFHQDKPVNPLTGIKNPTIISVSMASGTDSMNVAYISKIVYRGTTINPSSGSGASGTAVWPSLDQYKINCTNRSGSKTTTAFFMQKWTLTQGTIAVDTGKSGLITVYAAGNNNQYYDIPGGQDWDNYFIYYSNGSPVTYYYNRGNGFIGAYDPTYYNAGTNTYSKGATDYTPIVVGALTLATTAAQNYYKADYSNFGPLIDIWAPGSFVYSVLAPPNGFGGTLQQGYFLDPRETTLTSLSVDPYKSAYNQNTQCYDSGTSMACPVVSGVIACLLEKNPRWTIKEVKQWLRNELPELLLTSNNTVANGFTTAGYNIGYGNDTGTDSGSQFYSASSTKRTLFLPSIRNPSTKYGYSNNNGIYNPLTYFGDQESSRYFYNKKTNGISYPRRKTLQNQLKIIDRPTFSISASSLTASNGQTITITINTTNVPNGTKVRRLITGRHQSSSSNFYAFTPSYINNLAFVGDLTVNSNTASFTITITSTDKFYIYVRLDMFPTPSVRIKVN